MKLNQSKIEKAIEVLSPIALKLGTFPKELKGDIASFGASIIQAGILPTVLFYSEGVYDPEKIKSDKNEEESTKNRRAMLMKILFDVIQDNPSAKQVAPDSNTNDTTKRPLLEYVRQNLNKPEMLHNVTEAALAVKVALRAFAFSKDNDTNNEARNPNPSPETTAPQV